MAPKILVFAGSIRTGSFNARLAALAAKELALAGADVTRISLDDYPMPLYDGDLEAASGVPANALKLKQMMAAHRGVFIASPEYNASVTPLLKNTIDWISRVRERGEPPLAVFKNRVFALGGASDSRVRRGALADGAAPGAGARLRRAGDPRADHRVPRQRGVRRNGQSEGGARGERAQARAAAADRHGAGDGVILHVSLAGRARSVVRIEGSMQWTRANG